MDSKSMLKKNQSEIKNGEEMAVDSKSEVGVKNIAVDTQAKRKSRRKGAKEEIANHMPPREVNDEKEISGWEKKYRNSYDEAMDKLTKSSKLQWGKYWFTYNSKEMLAVKNSLQELNGLFNTPINAENSNADQILITMEEAYQKVIDNANTYLDKRQNPGSKEGKKRRQYVLSILTSCSYEKDHLKLAIKDVIYQYWDRKGDNENLKLTYKDVLRHCREERLSVKSNKVEGGNNSTVVKLIDGRYFKKAEKSIKCDFESVNDRIGEISDEISTENENGYDDPQGKFMAGFGNTLSGIVSDYMDNVDRDEKEKKDITTTLMSCLSCTEYDWLPVYLYSLQDKLKMGLDAADRDKVEEDFTKLKKTFFIFAFSKDKKLTSEEKDKRAQVQKALNKGYFREFMGTLVSLHNHIHEGADITSRNVATNRMCEKVLEFNDNIIVKSENAIVEINGQEEEGITMTNAQDTSMADLAELISEKHPAEKSMTPEAAKQLVQIQLLDMICGQCDRHEKNIYVQYDKKLLENDNKLLITGFTGIDNDMSFGEIRPTDVKNGYNRMAYLYTSGRQLAFMHIDKETFEKIMSIDNTYVEYQLADLGFTAEEMDCLKKRIEYIKEALRKKADDDDNFIIDDYKKVKDITDIYDVMEKDRKGNPKSSLVYFMNADITGKIA